MQLKIVRTDKAADETVSIYFEKPPIMPAWKAGQYGVFSCFVDGQAHTRTYSFHTPPDASEPGITVRKIPGGLVSGYLQTCQPNDFITLNGVGGDFFVEPGPEQRRHHVMFAAGSGITPVYAMIRALLVHEPKATIALYHSNKGHTRAIFRHQLQSLEVMYPQRLKVHTINTLTGSGHDDGPVFFKGRITPLIVRKILKDIIAHPHSAVEYYVCGPGGFIDTVTTAIHAVVPGHPIHAERFFCATPGTAINGPENPAREIILATHNEEKLIIVKGGQSILQAALDNGIRLRYSCTEGQCGVCRAQLVSGEVNLIKNHALTDQELKSGLILLCQGVPASDGITIQV